MCGRYNRRTGLIELADRWKIRRAEEILARYNVAPTQTVPTILADPPERVFKMMRWGLIPFWAKGPKPQAYINARSETAATSGAFRNSFKKQRCLIPADGFYEWAKEGTKKLPYHFQLVSHEPFCFAGLWDTNEASGEPTDTCCILTTQANGVVAPYHDRMPVILEPGQFDAWLLNGDKDILQPLPDKALTATRVSTAVNSPKNDTPECIEEV